MSKEEFAELLDYKEAFEFMLRHMKCNLFYKLHEHEGKELVVVHCDTHDCSIATELSHELVIQILLKS
jgi:hypothetical protein